MNYDFIYHKIQLAIEQDSYTITNESGEEAQKETMGFIDIGLPQNIEVCTQAGATLHPAII